MANGRCQGGTGLAQFFELVGMVRDLVVDVDPFLEGLLECVLVG